MTLNAPTGGITVTLASNDTLLTVPASVNVAANSSTATFNATASSSIPSKQNAVVKATIGSSSQSSTVALLEPLISSLVCDPDTMGQSAVGTCTVTLNAPTGGVTVTLSSNNPLLTIPASVNVLSGAITATFSATANPSIASKQSVIITATLGSSSKPATISLVPTVISGVACVPTSLGQSAVSTCTVTLNAPTGGITVTLTSNNALLTVPASVNVSANAMTATLSATANASIPSNQNATVTATFGATSANAVISLLTPLVSGVACSPQSIGQGAVSVCIVTVSQKAPVAGTTVTLTSNNTALTVPPSVTVASGATTATFNATAALSIASKQSATVTAKYGASSETAVITVQAPLVSSLVCKPSSLGQAAVGTCTVTLNAPTGGVTVTLTSNNALLTVPASVNVSANATTATFSATASASIPGNQSATLTAKLGTGSATAVISLLTPLVSSLTCTLTTLGQGVASNCTVTVSQIAPVGGAVVTLSSNNTFLAVPASVTVLAGAVTASFNATASLSITAKQSAKITATVGASSGTAAVTILAPLISTLVCKPTSLGQGAISTCTVTINAPTAGISVTLASNNALLTVPVSATIGVGATTTTFSATAAVSIASNQNAIVTATLGGASKTATIGLLTPLVSKVSCDPTSLGQSAVSTCTVTVSQAAPTGGMTVTLASNNALLTVPASVTVLSTASSATFSATAAASIPSKQNATITGQIGASSQTTIISLVAPLVSSVACNPASLGQNAVSTCTVTMNQIAPVAGNTVTISSNSALLSVPASVTATVGEATAIFSATAGPSITSNQTATVTATLGTSSEKAAISLLTPAVSDVTCSPTTLGQNATGVCTVTLTQAAAAGGLSVKLTSNNALLAVPASVTVASDATTAVFNASASHSIPTGQSATVTAALGSSAQTVTIRLVAPVLVSSVACKSTALSAGGTSSCSVNLSEPIPAISLVHVTSCGPQSFPVTTCTIPPTGSGNLIVVGWQSGAGVPTTITISSITDSMGNTYVEAGAARSVDTVAGSVADIWYAANSVSGATTLTITPSSSVAGGAAVIWEIAGADVTAPLDQTAVLDSQGASATPTGAAVTTTGAADVVISLLSAANVTGISGGTFVDDSTAGGSGWGHLITTSAGTYSAQWNQSSATYSSSTVAFVAAGAVTLSSNNPLLTVPAWVTVPVGARTAAFTATAGTPIPSKQSATLTAGLGASSQNTTITLTGPSSKSRVGGAGAGAVTVTSGQTQSASQSITANTIAPAFTAAPRALSFTASQKYSAQNISVFTRSPGVSFTASASSEGNWLSVGAAGTTPGAVPVSVSTSGLQPGTYQGIVTISISATSNVEVPVTLIVSKPTPQLSVSPPSENITLTEGASAASGQVTVLNTGGGTLHFNAHAAPESGNWLRLTGRSSGNATPYAPAALGFTADASGLIPGIYSGEIILQDADSSAQAVVNITMNVSRQGQIVVPSQSALAFSTVAGGSAPPPQSFTLSRQGAGSSGWTVQPMLVPNSLGPSPDWLSIDPSTGLSARGRDETPVQVSVNPAGLPAGEYRGSVAIDVPNGSTNSQSITVLLNVAPADTTAVDIGFSPGGVILPNGRQQQVSLFNPSNSTISYSSTISTSNGIGWLSISPSSGQLLPGSNSVSVVANRMALLPGVQNGTVTFGFDDGTVGVIQVVANTAEGPMSCMAGKPGYLIPVFRQPSAQSVLLSARPQPVQVQIVDDCNNPLSVTNGGVVQVLFSNGDAPIDLHDVGSGIWEGTWMPVNAAAQITLQVVASESSLGLSSIAAGTAVTVQSPALSAQ